jgi:hypothetical protein
MKTTKQRPEWLRDARRIWVEDDAGTYDRERLEDAWSRLFGEPLDKSTRLEEFDNQDEFFYLMPGDRVYRIGCDGDAIYRIGG